jgi:AAA domain
VGNEVLVQAVLNCNTGSVVAPAGCGKTDCIVDAVKAATGARKILVLTHTLAGVDSLRKRMKDKNVNLKPVDLETIAGWSLRLSAAFPQRSGLVTPEPRGQEWPAVYSAATQLVAGGFITKVLTTSYQRILVDEYQDCTIEQHALIVALSAHLPTCIFGDHLQAIFGFRNEQLVDWSSLSRDFPPIGTLTEPWRWKQIRNDALGKWLLDVRLELENSNQVNLAAAPACVKRIIPRSTSAQDLLKANTRAGLTPILKVNETLIVIGDKASELIRGKLASRIRCSAIEPVACQTLGKFLEALGDCTGQDRLTLVLDFAANAMSKVGKTPFQRRVLKRAGGARLTKKPSEAESAALEMLASDDLVHVLKLLECLRKRPGVIPFRRELLFALQSALKLVINGEQPDLNDAVWHVQNRIRHAGRRLAQRSVGSTLLVKGMQFDHAVIVAPEKLGRNDLYVALTRASRTITIVSGTALLSAKVEGDAKKAT